MDRPASARRIAALALPALGVLAAEPVYLLFESLKITHLQRLTGIWAGLSAFIGLRLVFGAWRALSGRWVVPGTN